MARDRRWATQQREQRRARARAHGGTRSAIQREQQRQARAKRKMRAWTEVLSSTTPPGKIAEKHTRARARVCPNLGIRACLEAEDFVPEENYEITHDIHYCFDGPKSGRIRVAQKGSKLFDRLAFYFSGFTEPTYKSNLEDLTIAAGGKVVSKLELHNLNLSSLATGEIEKAFIVCWVEPPKDCDSAEADGIVRERLGIAEGLAARMGAAALRHTLFLNAIAAHDPHMLSEM
ncbi:hypothetical protein KSP40_PGU006470 [Platanthera guangdongensis]|uniref:BRCT domain-containing protein n=1 Tax=Platanthera guangdongensis TaxID=2320717 RepID=A0ABR2MSI5_9ASPA